MHRSEWKLQATAHSEAARQLLRSGHYPSAYHLAGLGVEYALKATIARAFRNGTWPEKGFIERIHSHNLANLIREAQLEADRIAEEQRSIQFRANWNTVKDWRVESRYRMWTDAEASAMVEAVTMGRNGILTWIRRHW